MPTPTSAPTGVRPLHDLPVQATAAERKPLKQNAPFRYWVDPSQIAWIDGEPYARPIKVPIKPGAQNTPGTGDPTQSDGYQARRMKRVPVPLDFEVMAWGEAVRGYALAETFAHDLEGKPLVHYHDVWTRYDMVGSQLVPTFDRDGWQNFCRRATALIGGLHPQVVEASREQVRQRARAIRQATPANQNARDAADQLEAATKPKTRGGKAAQT